MSNRTLGILGLIGAPFLLIDTVNNGLNPYQSSSISGLFNFVYMAGWMCSLVALKRRGAFGEGRFGNVLFIVQMSFLTLGNSWSLYEWIQPQANTTLFYFLDAFWPISNLLCSPGLGQV